MTSNGGTVYILYKVVNSVSDSADSYFNAFTMTSGRPTLASVKQNCAALYGLNPLGPEGYHWRVCVEDKSIPGENGPKTFSWWDIQDENASLPIKEASPGQLNKFFNPTEAVDTASMSSAKGAFKTLGKAMSQAVGHDSVDQGPPVKVVAFKLLDLVKMHDDFASKNQGRGGERIPQPTSVIQQQKQPNPPPSQQRSRPTPPPAASRPPQSTGRPSAAPPVQQQRHAAAAATPNRPPQPAHEQSLMDFGTTSTTSNTGSTLHPSGSLSSKPVPPSNETRAEKLKREYAQKNHNASRVWDAIDERWIDADTIEKKAPGGLTGSASSIRSNDESPKKKEVGISLDPANAVGKSAAVQAAVHSRVNEMRESQEKALREVREREERKKREESEEDEVRRRLEPMIKTWCEEHGKKKQLRALLASLHTILWPGAQWKQVTIGDLLDDKKVKLSFHKASRVVHPDKTHQLPAEQRFLAKRIFDALSQAKNELDGAK